MASHARNLLFWQRHQSTFKPNSVVLITGAGSGIGKHVALTYARRQCRLVLVDIDEAAVKETGEQCRALHSEVLPLSVDVTSHAQCQSMMASTLARFHCLDILVLCAGIGAHHLFGATSDLSLFHRLMSVNFYGYLYCTHVAYPHLLASSGVLVAITSFSGEVGLPYRTAYCASKFAVTGFLEALRSELSVVSPPPSSNRFDIVICCPPTVATNLRRNSLTPDPTLRDVESKEAMSVDECANAIVDAADRRLRKAFFPFHSWIASYLRPIIPDVMDALIMRRAKL